MTLIADYALPALVAVATLGVLVMCVLVFRYGLGSADEDPEDAVRLVNGLRFGHAMAALGFAIVAVLAVLASISQSSRAAAMAPTASVAAAPGGGGNAAGGDVAGAGPAAGRPDAGPAAGQPEPAAPSARSAAEAPREAPPPVEPPRVPVEEPRVAAEPPRVAAEQPRVAAEQPRAAAQDDSAPAERARAAASRAEAPRAPAGGARDDAPRPDEVASSRRSDPVPDLPPATRREPSARRQVARAEPRAEPAPAPRRSLAPVAPDSDRPIGLPPRAGAGQALGDESTYTLPADATVRRHRTTVRGVRVDVEARSAGAERVYVVRLHDATGQPLTNVDVSLEGRLADGTLVRTPMEPGPEPGVHRARLTTTADGPSDLRLRVAQPDRRFEVSLAQAVNW